MHVVRRRCPDVLSPLLATALVSALAIAGCLGRSGGGGGGSPDPDPDLGAQHDAGIDGPADGGSSGQDSGGPPSRDGGPPGPSTLALNEVRCRGQEWVELHNVGDAPVAVGGWTLSDDPSQPERALHLPQALTVPAGGFVTLGAGGAAGTELPFGLSCDDDTLVLLAPGGVLVDLIALQDPGEGLTFGRLPDGAGAWQATVATPGAPNRAPGVAEVVLNEVDCRGRDWLELANPGAKPAQIGGWLVTDAPAGEEPDGDAYTFPAGTTVPAGGVLDLRQQDQNSEGFTFGIACGADRLSLLRPDGSVADAVEVPEHAAATTWGRLPSGSGPWKATEPTRGEPNRAPDTPAAALFDPLLVQRIEVTLGEDALQSLQRAPRQWVQGQARFVEPPVGAPEGWITVGVRTKGRAGSSRPLQAKTAFKLDFNRFEQGARVLGLEMLTLNNLVQDPAMLHEWLAYTIMRAMGVPAPRVGYVWLVINGEDYGLYANIESPDDVFLDRYFASTGHLYEGLYGQDLTREHLQGFEVDEGEAGDRADLLAVVQTIEEGWDEPGLLYAALADRVQWEEVVPMLATEIFIGHWDGYGPTRNNYFLHFDEQGRLSLLPWGTDQTFQGGWELHEGQGLLLNICMVAPECRLAYDHALLELVDVVVQLGLEESIREVAAGLAPWVAADPRREYPAEAVADNVQATIDFLWRRRAEVSEQLRCLLDDEPDRDGDGFPCDSDCDEDDPDIHPGAADTCGDGIDQDCNGWPDDAPDCPDCVEVRRGDHPYLVCTTPRTWAEARAKCQAEGVDMLVVDSAGESSWIFQQAVRVRRQPFWIGLSDQRNEGRFEWVDGTRPGFTRWAPGEPNNAGDEDCVHYWGDEDLWNDMPCEERLGVICEQPCPAQADADGDGFAACGADCDDGDPEVHPGAPEVCGDGVDQDCSGLPDDGPGCDCREVLRGQRRYHVCNRPASWAESMERCEGLGAGLVIVDDEAEQSWLVETILRAAPQPYWIGLSDRVEEDRFVWWDGDPAEYEAWGPGQPNNAGEEDCVILYDETNAWNDRPCGDRYAAICEQR